MKRKVVAFSTLVMAIPLSLWMGVRLNSAPDLDVTSTHDFGSVSKGTIAVADVPVRNLGNAPLKIAGVSTSCGCTTATVSPMTISPGGEATLHVEYDSNAHEADQGAIKRYIFISSNDPSESDMRIQFSVFVETNAVSQATPKLTSPPTGVAHLNGWNRL